MSLLESILDVQFEVITTYLNNGKKLPERGDIQGSAHTLLSAPYGIYETQRGYLALAMGDLQHIGKIIGVNLDQFQDKALWFSSRDSIRKLLSEQLLTDTVDNWIQLLNANGIWCGKVLDYNELNNQKLVQDLQLKQTVQNTDTITLTTTRSPIQLDGKILTHSKAAPKVGEDNIKIHQFFLND